MKKLLLTAFLALTTLASAQDSWAWVSGNTIDTTVAANAYTELKIPMVITKGDSLEFGIAVLEKDMSSTWDGMVCVYGKCLGSIPAAGDSATMNPMSSADTGYVRLTINPFADKDSAYLSILVYDINNPSDADTAVWIVDQQNVGVDEAAQPELSLFPNPAIDQVTITGNDLQQIKVINALGQVIAQRNLFGTDQITLGTTSWPSGTYIISVVYGNGQVKSLPLSVQ